MSVIDIALFGTSLSCGWWSRDWIGAVRDQLQPACSSELRVYRLGDRGVDSAWGVQNVQRVAQLRPAIVLIEFCMNDALTERGISLRQSRDNVATMIGAIRDARPDTQIAIMSMNPVVNPAGVSRPNLPAYYAQYAPLAAGMGVTFIDNFTAWGPATLAEISDQVHPDLVGVQRVTIPTVKAALLPMLA